LIGGGGRDLFAIGTASGAETIVDFQNGKDRIGLLEQIQFGGLTFQQVGSSTLIGIGNDVIATLKRIRVETITRADFVSIE
jgi:Ca2+-binding RTX toxin-like protein